MKAILVNVFGGIVNCATIASGVIAAVKNVGLTVPLVVRLEGRFLKILGLFYVFNLGLFPYATGYIMDCHSFCI